MRHLESGIAYLRSCRKLRRLAAVLGHTEAFLTGGSLRDVLLGIPPQELDLAVAGNAATLAAKLAEQLHGTSFPLGKEPLVTYRVVAPHLTVDLWPLATSLELDAWRRDFTVNALFFPLPQGPLVDFVGGLADLAAGKLQVVREENLASDPLRVLRGLRLSLTRPLRVTARSQAMLKKAAPGLRQVARERIREEVTKILEQAPLPTLWHRGMQLAIWPSLNVCPRIAAPSVELCLARLEELRRRPGSWGKAAQALAPAGLALASLFAAGDPKQALVQALTPLGIEGKGLQRLERWVSFGEHLLQHGINKEELAIQLPQRQPLVWWFIRSASTSPAQLQKIWRWWVTFCRRPPLVPSEEVVTLLHLPPGPERAQVLLTLRQLQASGRLRSAAAARRFLQRLSQEKLG